MTNHTGPGFASSFQLARPCRMRYRSIITVLQDCCDMFGVCANRQ